jgi:hypothetical protein
MVVGAVAGAIWLCCTVSTETAGLPVCAGWLPWPNAKAEAATKIHPDFFMIPPHVWPETHLSRGTQYCILSPTGRGFINLEDTQAVPKYSALLHYLLASAIFGQV